MNKNVWKTLFELLPEDNLRFIAKQTGTKVKGFREVNAAPRAMLIPQMILPKQITTVRSFLNFLTEENEKLTLYREKSKSELLACLRDGDGPFDVLFALLSSGDSNLQMLGEVLFNELELSGELQKLVKDFYSTDDEEQETEQGEEPVLEEPVAQSDEAAQEESTNKRLRRLEKKHETLKDQYEQSQEKRKEMEQELKELRIQLRDKQVLEGQMKKINEDHQKLVDKQDKMQKELNHKQALLNNMEKEKEQLLQENDDLNAKLQALTQTLEKRDGGSSAQTTDSDKKRQSLIVMIGKVTKNNLELISSTTNIQLLDVEQVEQELEGLLPDAKQVWMLTYETPFLKQRKIRKLVDLDRLKEFKDYLGLKSHFNR